MPDGLPVALEAFPRTVRLVSTARLRAPVLQPLVDDDAEFAELAELEGATSARLTGQDSGTAGIDPKELVFGVPHAAFINASFIYAKPREPGRFNSPARGAWYAGLLLETARREVVFHMRAFLAAAGDFNAIVDYAEMLASFAGQFVDLRGIDPAPACLHPDQAIGYPAGNALAAATRSEGLNGIIYPSVRHPGGTCVAALWPHAVQSVIQADVYRATWAGSLEPTFVKAST
ncbi:MAG: RES family NAD+ phosphorylase [Alphaproteobacteria bacterium]|nr:RES family NAD+ phosphorylase [Alphaproteobacteria bacterium]